MCPQHPAFPQPRGPWPAGLLPSLGRRRQRPPGPLAGAPALPARRDSTGRQGLAAFLGCCLIDSLGSLFAGDINLAGSRDGCVLTSHPGLDSVGSRGPSARRRWRAPGLSGRLWSQWISRNRCWDRLAAPPPRQPASLQTGPVNYSRCNFLSSFQ